MFKMVFEASPWWKIDFDRDRALAWPWMPEPAPNFEVIHRPEGDFPLNVLLKTYREPWTDYPRMRTHLKMPVKLVKDLGQAFSLGFVGASAWQLFKTVRHNPPGHRFDGLKYAIMHRALRTGLSFGKWGFWFSLFQGPFIPFDNSTTKWKAATISGALTAWIASIGYSASNSRMKQMLMGGMLLFTIEMAIGWRKGFPPGVVLRRPEIHGDGLHDGVGSSLVLVSPDRQRWFGNLHNKNSKKRWFPGSRPLSEEDWYYRLMHRFARDNYERWLDGVDKQRFAEDHESDFVKEPTYEDDDEVPIPDMNMHRYGFDTRQSPAEVLNQPVGVELDDDNLLLAPLRFINNIFDSPSSK